jgi:hypothetical protein
LLPFFFFFSFQKICQNFIDGLSFFSFTCCFVLPLTSFSRNTSFFLVHFKGTQRERERKQPRIVVILCTPRKGGKEKSAFFYCRNDERECVCVRGERMMVPPIRLLASRHAQRRYGGSNRLFCCFGPWRLLGEKWQRQQQQQQKQRLLSSRASLWSHHLQGMGREQQQQQIQPVKLAYDFYEPPPAPTSSPEQSAAAASSTSSWHGADQGGKTRSILVSFFFFFFLLVFRLWSASFVFYFLLFYF